MWLAVCACGGASTPVWMTKPDPKVSIFDAPPLAGATYVATVAAGDFGNPGPHVAIERGSFRCGQLVEILDDRRGGDQGMETRVAEATKTCEPELARLLRTQAGFVLVIDGKGQRWLSAAEVLAAAAPIDTPSKALLAVWVTGKYNPSWSDGDRGYGGPEGGLVRQVAGGHEVIASTSETDSRCGGGDRVRRARARSPRACDRGLARWPADRC